MKNLVIKMLTFALVISAFTVFAAAADQDIQKGSKSQIDLTNKNSAYMKIRYLSKTDKTLKITVELSGQKYTYDLNNKGEDEIISFNMGSGSYTVKVLENIVDARYSVVQQITVDVKLSDPHAPYLIPIQNINYTSESSAVKKAAELCKDVEKDIDKVEKIYGYIVNNIIYDTDKAEKIISGQLTTYIPDIDVVLDGKKGICFDYSSLLAAMLRSEGIPAKLVMGYIAPDNLYHAWNEVYIEGQGWIKINGSVYFNGKEFSRMDATFASGDKAGAKSDYIGNGKNYTTKYEY